MAIVIEEEKKSGSGIVTLFLWVILIGAILAGAYYIFFKQPELLEVAMPADFKNTEQISKIELKPEELLNNAQFKSLKAHIPIPLTPSTGRPNPFLGL